MLRGEVGRRSLVPTGRASIGHVVLILELVMRTNIVRFGILTDVNGVSGKNLAHNPIDDVLMRHERTQDVELVGDRRFWRMNGRMASANRGIGLTFEQWKR